MSRRTTPVAALVVVGVSLSACGAPTGADTRSAPTTTLVTRTVATAGQVVDEFRRSGLSVDGATDTTKTDCASVGCAHAVSTSTVLVRSFPTPGQAEIYGLGTGAFQVGTVVLTFTALATAEQQRQYEAATARVVR